MSTVADIVRDVIRTGYLINPLQLCFHEIGHAVIARRVGRTIARIEVNSHGGCMRSEGVASPLIGLLCAIGGDRAELLAPGSMTELIGFGHHQDQQDADRCLNLIASGPTHREWILEDARRQVDEVLVAQRDRLGQLARLLLRHQRLEGRQLAALLE